MTKLEALSCSEFPNSSDAISRRAAIDIVEFECGKWRGLAKTIVKEIEHMPSAQPEIVRCKDCKYNVSSHKCLHPESFFLVPDDDFYCGYAERRTDETD